MRIITGNCLDVLPTLPEVSVQCCITSPPYWGLRDYGTATWDGGNAECDHRLDTRHQAQGTTSQRAGRANIEEQRNENFRDACGKCGARRVDQQLGLERAPEEYVANLVAVFREVRRVLRDDGTLWCNLGDTYFTQPHGRNGSQANRQRSLTGLKHKDLVGIPWRVARALQADGWYLRSDIIWHKPNPMPESVRDRPTKAHEYIFLLSKSERYYYDAEAVREPDSGQDHRRTVINGQASLEPSGGLLGPHRGIRTSEGRNGQGRNRRSVWTIPTEPSPEAHFATFPRALVTPCVLAGSRPGDTVLDPFGGAGTVGLVAKELNRDAIVIELKLEYVAMAERRCRQEVLPLAGVD